MPVSLVVGDISSFRKYVKYIGRAYQKRSVAMIQLCRLFLEISPGKPDQMDALKSLLETVEDALKSAVDAGKDRSEAADAAFATAEEELDWYAGWQHPEEQSVLDDVQNIIEDAAQKDSHIMKTHKRLSSRLGLNKRDSPPSSSLVKVHFQILQSPTDRREAPVVTCELGPDVKISELLWTFSRLPEDQRISLKQNPHFYFSRDLSDQASAYDDQFRLEPLKDQDLKPEKDSVVLVLLDRAGQIFVDYQTFSKTYGNIWRPCDAIILKDLQGILEAANRINSRISGDVCVWQRGGGRLEENMSKWTEVLDRALDLPDVDWLIRSETSPNEAFDIEVTGGWERCSPVTALDPPPVEQDYLTPTTPPHESAHIPLEEATSLAPESSPVSTVSSSSQKTFHSSEDTPPTDVTPNFSFEEPQSIVEECLSPIEDEDPLPPTLPESSPPQLEAVVHPPVHVASTPTTPLVENEPAPASITTAPERPAPMAGDSICSQDEANHTQSLPACSSSRPLSLPIDTTVTPSSSSMYTPLVDTPSDDIPPQTKASHSPVQPTSIPPASSPLGIGELVPVNTASTPDRIPPLPELARPEIEAIRTPVHLAVSSSGAPQGISNNLGPASIAPTLSRTIPLDDTPLQVEAARLPNALSEPPKPASTVPTPDHTSPASETSLRSKADPTIQSASSLEHPIPPTGGSATLTSKVSALDRCPPLSEPVRSRVDVVRRPPSGPPPALVEPTLPIVKEPAPTGGTPVPRMSPPSPERVSPQVEVARSPIQNARAPPKPHISSIMTGSAPPSPRVPPPSERGKVEAPSRPTVRPVHPPPPPPPPPLPLPLPDPRTSFVGKQLPPLNGVSVPDTDVALSSRSRIKSHPRRMVTPMGQRRSMALPDIPPSGQPMIRPVENSTATGHGSATSFHTPLVDAPNLGQTDTRGGYQGYAKGPAASPSVQVNAAISASASNSNPRVDPIGRSRRPTVTAGQMPPQLAALSPGRSTPPPVEKPMPSSAHNRANSAPIARQDRTVGALSHPFQARSSGLAVISEGQSAPRGYSVARSGTPPIVPTAAPTTEKVNATVATALSTLPNGTRMSSMVNTRHSSVSRKSMVSPEQVSSHLAARSSHQPVQSVTSPSSRSSRSSDPVGMARPDKAANVLSYNSRTYTSGVTTATESQAYRKGYPVGSKVPPASAGGAATLSSSPVWNNTSRTSSRIKTKDLISRHKKPSASDARSPSVAESASPSKAASSGLSQTTGKPNDNRTDSGIELWDYDPHGATSNRRRSHDTSLNGHRDRRPSSALPTNSPVGASNANNKDITGPSVLLKKSRSRASVLRSPSPVVSRVHSGSSKSTPLLPERAQTPPPSVNESSSTPSGRREPFINRKPQLASQSTLSGATGYSTPPRSSTPSSMSHSVTSTQATMVTPATSFTILSRAPSPGTEAGQKSWFRRIVLDPVKSKLGLGYGS